MRFLVTGASGNVGAEVVRALAADVCAGARALTRGGRLPDLPPGVQTANGDLDDAPGRSRAGRAAVEQLGRTR